MTTADGWPASNGYIIDTAATTLRLTRDAIVQFLTRIEDAEMLAWSMAQDKPRVVQNALDIERCALLLRAGIDPDKWREVKDEEA
jgi:hypothetical protein